MIWKSLNPNSYKTFVKYPFRQGFDYFFFLMLICIVVFFVLLLPQIADLSNNLGSKLDHFETFSVKVDTELKEPFYLMKSPKVLVDFNKTNLTNEQMLINDNEIIYKKYFFFGERRIGIHNFENVLENKEAMQNLLPLLFVLILPSILAWIFIFFAIKYFLLILVAAFIAFIAAKERINFSRFVKIGFYAATLSLILEVALLPLFRISWWITLGIFIAYYALGVWITEELEFSSKHKGGKPDFRPKALNLEKY
jgi:hypothetical protein